MINQLRNLPQILHSQVSIPLLHPRKQRYQRTRRPTEKGLYLQDVSIRREQIRIEAVPERVGR